MVDNFIIPFTHEGTKAQITKVARSHNLYVTNSESELTLFEAIARDF